MDRLIINSNTCENVSQRQMFTTCFWKFLHFDEKAFHKDFTNLPFFAGEGGKKTLTNQQKSQRIPNGHWHVLFIHEVKLCQKSGHIDNGFGFFAVFFFGFQLKAGPEPQRWVPKMSVNQGWGRQPWAVVCKQVMSFFHESPTCEPTVFSPQNWRRLLKRELRFL